MLHGLHNVCDITTYQSVLPLPVCCRWRSSTDNQHRVSHWRCWCTGRHLGTSLPSFDGSAASSGLVRRRKSSACKQRTDTHWIPVQQVLCRWVSSRDSPPTLYTQSCHSPALLTAAAAQTSASLFIVAQTQTHKHAHTIL